MIVLPGCILLMSLACRRSQVAASLTVHLIVFLLTELILYLLDLLSVLVYHAFIFLRKPSTQSICEVTELMQLVCTRCMTL